MRSLRRLPNCSRGHPRHLEAWPAEVDLGGLPYDSLSRQVSARQRLEPLARQRGQNAADRYRLGVLRVARLVS